MRKPMVFALAGLFPAVAAGASLDPLVEKSCSAGSPWRLTPPPSGMSTVEAPIKLNGTAGQTVLICNCTDDQPGKNAGIWIRASMSTDAAMSVSKALGLRLEDVQPPKAKEPEPGPPNWAYYLPNKSCVSAGAVTIIAAPVDNSITTWGTFVTEGK